MDLPNHQKLKTNRILIEIRLFDYPINVLLLQNNNIALYW